MAFKTSIRKGKKVLFGRVKSVRQTLREAEKQRTSRLKARGRTTKLPRARLPPGMKKAPTRVKKFMKPTLKQVTSGLKRVGTNQFKF